jgi:hypothetical protein
MEIVSDELLELFPLFLFLIEQLLIFIGPFSFFEFKQELLAVLDYAHFWDIAYWSIIAVILFVLRRL